MCVCRRWKLRGVQGARLKAPATQCAPRPSATGQLARTWTETTNSSSPHTMNTFMDRCGPFQQEPPVQRSQDERVMRSGPGAESRECGAYGHQQTASQKAIACAHITISTRSA